MKIFEKDGKINFVDDNNVFVGFDFCNGDIIIVSGSL